MFKVSWPEFKNFINTKETPFQYFETTGYYRLIAFDGFFSVQCELDKTPSDTTQLDDFETNYKPEANKNIWQYDSDGAAIVRQKAAKKGWTYGAVPVEFQTSRLSDTLYSKTHDDVSRSWITMKAYNASDVEVTTPGIANVNYATIVKTVIDFEPTYDYEIIGGFIRTINDINQDIRLWIIAVPDVPAQYGGSKEMVGGLNLNYMKPENIYFVDGRVTKLLAYNATNHTNKLRFILKYPAGAFESISINIELYKA